MSMRRRHGREAIRHRKVFGVSYFFLQSLLLGREQGRGKCDISSSHRTAVPISILGQMRRLTSIASSSHSDLVRFILQKNEITVIL